MRRGLFLTLLPFLVVGCDSGPSGPGDLTGSIQAPNASLGAVALEVVGPGIEGFSGAGGSRVFWAPGDNPAAFRVIVVSEHGGEVRFTVAVRDLAKRKPRSTVISMVDLENRLLPVTGDVKVRFRYQR